MLGDNIYGAAHAGRLRDEVRRAVSGASRTPGVTFHAAIGNHDEPTEINYAKFNMEGQRYYTFRRNERRLAGLVGAGVRFFVLDSRSFDPRAARVAPQTSCAGQARLEDLLLPSSALHVRPLHARGARVAALASRADPRRRRRGRGPRGSRALLRTDCPAARHLLLHLRRRRIAAPRRHPPVADPREGFDTDFHFMMMEISGDALYFQAISRTGRHDRCRGDHAGHRARTPASELLDRRHLQIRICGSGICGTRALRNSRCTPSPVLSFQASVPPSRICRTLSVNAVTHGAALRAAALTWSYDVMRDAVNRSVSCCSRQLLEQAEHASAGPPRRCGASETCRRCRAAPPC